MDYLIVQLADHLRRTRPPPTGGGSPILTCDFDQDEHHLLVEAGDTYFGMDYRALYRCMDAEGFEPTFSVENGRSVTYGYGRRSDAIVANFTFHNGWLASANAECAVRSVAGFRDRVRVEDQVVHRGSHPGRIWLDALEGFRVRIGELTLMRVTMPLWWRGGTLMTPPRRSHNTFVTASELNDYFLVPGSSASPWTRANFENGRRFSRLPDDWKHLLDYDGKRTFADVLEFEECRNAGGGSPADGGPPS